MPAGHVPAEQSRAHKPIPNVAQAGVAVAPGGTGPQSAPLVHPSIVQNASLMTTQLPVPSHIAIAPQSASVVQESPVSSPVILQQVSAGPSSALQSAGPRTSQEE